MIDVLWYVLHTSRVHDHHALYGVVATGGVCTGMMILYHAAAKINCLLTLYH